MTEKKEIEDNEVENFVQVGDVVIASKKNSLQDCSNLVEKIIKKKSIKAYLEGYKKRKALGMVG